MRLYQRDGAGPIYWDPEQTDTGKQAVKSVVGTVDAYPVDVDRETGEAIREEYRRLVDEQTSGGSS